jgi:hypothetical protein
MKKITNGRSAMTLFVASFLLAGGLMASCNNNTAGQTQTPAHATATLTPNCPTCVPVAFSTDTTGPQGGPKLFLIGRTNEAIPAGTDIKLEVVLPAASTDAAK